MELKHPFFLLLIFIIPILELFHSLFSSKAEGALSYSSIKFFPLYMKKKGSIVVTFLKLVRYLVIILIIISLSQPRVRSELESVIVDVIDIILVLDISSSMLAEDFKPNRLAVVKKAASDFIENRPIDRIGLSVFAGESFIQCPLTMDKDVLKELVSDIKVAEQDYDGTAIGIAIANATNRLRQSKTKNKIIILLSDGSNNTGEIDPITAAEIASKFNIKIYTIGAGTNQSYTRISGRGLMKNEIDESTLKIISKKTNGKYFRALDEESLSDIYKQIDLLEKTKVEVKKYNSFKELYPHILLIASFLLVFSEYIRYYKTRMSI